MLIDRVNLYGNSDLYCQGFIASKCQVIIYFAPPRLAAIKVPNYISHKNGGVETGDRLDFITDTQKKNASINI